VAWRVVMRKATQRGVVAGGGLVVEEKGGVACRCGADIPAGSDVPQYE